MQQQKRSPADFIKQSLGRQVIVKLNGGSEFTGQLICLDGTFNIVLSKAQQHREGHNVEKYNQVFLRGNNVMHIIPKAAKQGTKSFIPKK